MAIAMLSAQRSKDPNTQVRFFTKFRTWESIEWRSPKICGPPGAKHPKAQGTSKGGTGF